MCALSSEGVPGGAGEKVREGAQAISGDRAAE